MTQKTRDTDVAFIQALAELLRENDLTELEVKREYGEADKLNVRVSRGGTATVAHVVAPAPAPVAPPAPATPAAPATAEANSGDPAAHPGAVTSPMVGTVYLQS
ncbi:MAG: acetyl-CoA carboxylase, biotin carboxyl carrier protein, partial [Maritimibacter sp.]|nr:acetyl-CoA carboxylase, biotin carboxyl carrier protein [Maritimibacter sp.]